MKSVTVNGKPVQPGKVICIGRNYVAHIEELGNEIPEEMVIFMKPNTAIGTELHATHGGEVLHYEAEIAYLYHGGRFSAAALGLDLTKRDLQSKLKDKGLPWERSKVFEGAALFSEFVALPDSDAPLGLSLHIDGTLIQKGDTSLMLYSPAVILAEVQKVIPLEDGDVVMTGTPKGVGQVQAGQEFMGALSCREQALVSVCWKAAD
ncbi:MULTISPECIES: fumarylacetoacetate hydrolase family protein [Photobacterium]|uniref:2-keto-4-pentenoate hydratase n=1 Tax=Photobacterium halotolerans TaxID=265726 RepID=A0A0F5VE03_9GAMM|nr:MULTISPECIES: fumarylacetoacetate hydrolase family protein [Photobacterium]KKD00401.1 2-keto-4-pentenoate hydratase [Photobacterium halotolerans]UIP29641.1 fumarylacetoacetate hydrolase family protein [Photobacterium sp. TLY01]